MKWQPAMATERAAASPGLAAHVRDRPEGAMEIYAVGYCA
jgi:hypothetical protein